jgi:hypothetical protein
MRPPIPDPTDTTPDPVQWRRRAALCHAADEGSLDRGRRGVHLLGGLVTRAVSLGNRHGVTIRDL